jgi:very-short-patch-repair endonuclease
MENKLWHALRDRRLAGPKFRRQRPHGPFILDAFCVAYLTDAIRNPGYATPTSK